jgi:hypothetical protein
VLELGKAGAHGVPGYLAPVLADGEVVAALPASIRKGATAATIGQRGWTLTAERCELTARWDTDPAGTARLRARQPSWRSSWELDLEGTPVEVRTVSGWRGTRHYLVGGCSVAVGGTGAGWWSPRPTLDAGPSLPLERQVLLLWVESVLSGFYSSTLALGDVAHARSGRGGTGVNFNFGGSN